MKMGKPFVSIIIPVYRVSKYIERCLRSVMQQQDDIAMECILVDDCSPDDSMDIIKRLLDGYDGPITFHTTYHKQNLGLSAARNTGMKMAQGDYLFFIDSDDYITDDCLQKLTDVVKNKPEVQVVKGNHFGSVGMIDVNSIPVEPINNDTLLKLLYMCVIPVMAWNTLIKRSMIEEMRLSFCQGLLYEDNMWTVQLFRHVDCFQFIPDKTYYHEVNHGSIIEKQKECPSRSLPHRIKIVDELLNSFDSRHFVSYTCYIIFHLIQMFDITDKEKHVAREDIDGVVQLRNRLFRYSIRKGRLILVFSEMLLFKPFRYLIRFRLLRCHYDGIYRVVYKMAMLFNGLHEIKKDLK